MSDFGEACIGIIRNLAVTVTNILQSITAGLMHFVNRYFLAGFIFGLMICYMVFVIPVNQNAVKIANTQRELYQQWENNLKSEQYRISQNNEISQSLIVKWVASIEETRTRMDEVRQTLLEQERNLRFSGLNYLLYTFILVLITIYIIAKVEKSLNREATALIENIAILSPEEIQKECVMIIKKSQMLNCDPVEPPKVINVKPIMSGSSQLPDNS